MVKAVLFNPFSEADDFLRLPRAFPDLDMQVAGDSAELAELLPGAEILVTSNRVYTPDTAAVIREAGGALRWIQFVTSGFDKAVASGLPKGVTVTNVAGLRAFAVAEHALTLMLGLVRQIRATEAARPTGEWCRDAVTPAMDNLTGKHLVIVGAGAIGQDIARKAKAFDMRVTGVTRSDKPIAHFDALAPRDALVKTASEADVLVVAATYEAQTHAIISREVIDAMPRHALFVNIARGLLVDEPALVEALQDRRIAGAGLDVMAEEPLPPDHPLWRMDNVLLTPHVGGAGSAGLGATHASMFADNLRLWFAGEPLGKVVIQRT